MKNGAEYVPHVGPVWGNAGGWLQCRRVKEIKFSKSEQARRRKVQVTPLLDLIDQGGDHERSSGDGRVSV